METALTKETAIAYRILETATYPTETVEVLIGKPECVNNNPEEWICCCRIIGAGKDLDFQLHGIDSVQALRAVFMIIDAAIQGEDLSLLWLGNKDLGFV